jgi:SAM-dependent methyltransferase
VTVDHYAGAAQGWAEGAALVYRPIAGELVASTRHPLRGRTVLDVGAGTGVASDALVERGARVLAVDLSVGMLAWHAADRPAAAVADVTALPLPADSVDDVAAAFVLNHLAEPARGLAELARVTRRDGGILACVYGTAGRSEARELLDDVAHGVGWVAPQWYCDLKEVCAPHLGSADDMARAAMQAGLVDVHVEERPVDVGVTRAEQLVDYRLGQAQFAGWLEMLTPQRADEIRHLLVTAVTPVMQPYRPLVVFLSALAG